MLTARRPRAARALAALLALAAVSAGAAAAAASVDPASALKQIDSQVEARLGLEPPTGSAFLPHDMRFQATQHEVVSALNSLDVKAGKAPEAKPAAAEKHKSAVVAAFASIAVETEHRATAAVHWLRQRAYALGQKVKTDAHNYKAWMDAHRARAAAQITAEVERLGALTDEIAHLKQVAQDAISKDRSYQVQLNQLISERQLQRTPPVMPAVVAAGLSDAQFEAATGKLNAFRAKARQVIEQTTGGIHKREHLLDQGTKWVEDSKLVLQKWYSHQVSVYNSLVTKGKQAVAEAERRVLAVERIQADAKRFHADYLNALKRMHIEARIEAAEKSLKHYGKVKAEDTYESARLKSYMAGLRLEIEGLKKQLKKVPGNGKVVPPPAVWGVLARFQAFAVHYTGFHAPSYHNVLSGAPAAGLYGHGMPFHQPAAPAPAPQGDIDPSITSSVPTQAEAASLAHPGATWGAGLASAVGGGQPYNPWTAPSPAAAGVAAAAAAGAEGAEGGSGSESGSGSGSGEGSAAAFLEQMGAALAYPQQQQPQQQQPQQYAPAPRAPTPAFSGGVPAPPQMPNLAAPPRPEMY